MRSRGIPILLSVMTTLSGVAACSDEGGEPTETVDSGVTSADHEHHDDDDTNPDEPDETPDDSTPADDKDEARDGSADGDEGLGDLDGGSEADGSTSAQQDAGADAQVPALDAGAESDASAWPALPKVLSLSGCEELGVPALCSVTQTEDAFRANCGGTIYSGKLAQDRSFNLDSPKIESGDSGTIKIQCAGKVQLTGALTADCTQASSTSSSSGDDTSCKLRSDTQILPDVACMELPSSLSDVVLCSEGDAAGGASVRAGACSVIQDGCQFQAECADGLTLTGSVSRTGVSFSHALKALADAEKPTEGEPAFLKGAEVPHSCTATLEAGQLSGTCSAGAATRRGTPTSVCGVSATATPVPSCDPIAPSTEQLFALDSCDLLKNGDGQNPGIGEPVCAFRQNNCIWDVQCGDDPMTKFSGRLKPGARKLEWRLLTGTPCEMSFDAEGKMTGKCTVPGQTACTLSSKPAAPGGDDCPVLPAGVNFKSRGCGGSDPLDCRAALQHKCNFMAICSFTTRIPDVVFAVETSTRDGRGHLEFEGVNGYSCAVDQATEADIASGDRQANEWYGQCTNAVGGQCRDNYDAVTNPTGFRGLQLFFDVQPE